jgi:hypothetical protein
MSACDFDGVTIGQNETFSIKYDPEDVDVNTIMYVKIFSSTIYSTTLHEIARHERLLGLGSKSPRSKAGHFLGWHEIGVDEFAEQ